MLSGKQVPVKGGSGGRKRRKDQREKVTAALGVCILGHHLENLLFHYVALPSENNREFQLSSK